MARKKRRAESRRQRPGWAALGQMDTDDIEAVAFLVLMLAAKSAQEDLKATMKAVRQMNRRKARRIEAQDGRRSRIDAAVRDADRATRKGMKLVGALEDLSIDRLRKDLDGLSEMGEMESLRLQMAMDRLSKSMSTLSNALKKISETADTITSHLK